MMDGEPFIAGMDSLADAVSSFFHLCFTANLEYPKVKIEQSISNLVLHLAVLGIREMLMRIRIRGSVPLTNGSRSGSKLRDRLLSSVTLRTQKEYFFHEVFFSYNLPAETLVSSVLKI